MWRWTSRTASPPIVELDERASRIAQGMIALKQNKGARVGYLGKNCDRYFEVLLGAFKARTVVVGVNWRLAAPEIAYVLTTPAARCCSSGKSTTRRSRISFPIAPGSRR